MNNLFKPESFVKFEKKSLNINFNNTDKLHTDKLCNNLKKNYISSTILKHQDYILDILLDLREFDEKNGTNLFKNISYNNLNTFILKNNF